MIRASYDTVSISRVQLLIPIVILQKRQYTSKNEHACKPCRAQLRKPYQGHDSIGPLDNAHTAPRLTLHQIQVFPTAILACILSEECFLPTGYVCRKTCSQKF